MSSTAKENEPVTPAPETEPAPEPAPPKPDPAAEVKSALMSNERFWNRLQGKREAPKPKEEKPEPAATAEPAPEPEPLKAETPKPKAKTKAPPKVAPEKIAEITAREQGREIGRAIAETLQPKPVAPKPQEPDPIPDEYAKDAQVYAIMESLFPDKYGLKDGKTLTNRLREAIKVESDYMQKWLDAHPGEDFDGNAEEHNTFYKRTFPAIDDDDFQAARDEMIAQRAEAKATQKLSAEIEALRKERRSEQIKPEASGTMERIHRGILETVNPKLKSLTAEELKTLDQTDPLAADILATVDQAYGPIIEANLAVHRGATAFQPDNPTHMQLFEVAEKLEQRVQSLPVEDRFDDTTGRYFATRQEWLRMNEADRARHWYIGEQEIAYALETEILKEAKQGYQQYEKKLKVWAEKSGIAQPSATPATQKPDETPSAKPAKPPVKTEPEPRSPSVPLKTALGGGSNGQGGSEKSGRDIFFSRLTGR